jgi:hypothetical protein
MTIDAPDVGDDRVRLLRPTAFTQDETSVQVVEVERAQLLDRYRLVIELPLFRRIVTLRKPMV